MLTLTQAEAAWEAFCRGPTPAAPPPQPPELTIDTGWAEAGEAWSYLRRWKAPERIQVPPPTPPVLRPPADWPRADAAFRELTLPLAAVAPAPAALPPVLQLPLTTKRLEAAYAALETPVFTRRLLPPEFDLEPDDEAAFLAYWDALHWEPAQRQTPIRPPAFHIGLLRLTCGEAYARVFRACKRPRRTSPQPPSLQLPRLAAANAAWGRLADLGTPRTSRRRQAHPPSLLLGTLTEAEAAWRALGLDRAATNDLQLPELEWPVPTIGSAEEAGKAVPRRHAWQSLSRSKRRGADDWPIRKGRKNKPGFGRRTMVVGRWHYAFAIREGYEPDPYRPGRRRWRERKVLDLTQRTWPECIELAGGDAKLAERYFRTQTHWVQERIHPRALPRWEAREEYNQNKRDGLPAGPWPASWESDLPITL